MPVKPKKPTRARPAGSRPATRPKRKTKSELMKAARKRKLNAKKGQHKRLSTKAKKVAKKIPKSQRVKRARKAAKTKRRLYGPKGRVN